MNIKSLLLLSCIAFSPMLCADQLSDLKQRVEQGDVSAQTDLGVEYVLGIDVPRDYSQAYKLLLEAAHKGNKLAQYNLGLMYDLGEGVGIDKQIAAKWFKKSAEQGDVPAQFHLGLMFAHGTLFSLSQPSRSG
ncbi:MAG: tetratricopeptide repeat protein [Methylococcales bacterium]